LIILIKLLTTIDYPPDGRVRGNWDECCEAARSKRGKYHNRSSQCLEIGDGTTGDQGKFYPFHSTIKSVSDIPSTQTSATNAAQRFHYISADVSTSDGATNIIEAATAWNNGRDPDIVWCIAGAAHPGLFLESSATAMRRQMDVNFWSCSDMAHAVLSKWLSPSASKDEHHLIFTSSVVAFYAVAGYAPYAPAKAAIKALSDTLAQEILLYGDHVKIHTVFPGTTTSPGRDKENATKPAITHILEESDPVQTPEEVARKAIKGLENGDYLVTVGWLGSLMRGVAWGGARRNNSVVDLVVSWAAALICLFVNMDLNGKVRAYGKKHGHPSTYKKGV